MLVLLLGAGGCKKACYACTGVIVNPYSIDTYYVYGQIKYDTGGGSIDSSWRFTSCEVNSNFHYGNFTIVPSLKRDTVIDCQQLNK